MRLDITSGRGTSDDSLDSRGMLSRSILRIRRRGEMLRHLTLLLALLWAPWDKATWLTEGGPSVLPTFLPIRLQYEVFRFWIPVKLISCIKGARALHGMSPRTSFRVKWAPEVYDPPVTSTSRTVKSPHQRSKAKQKEHYKHKSNKGKSPRRIINEAKYANRRSKYNATDPRIIRLHSLGDRSVPLNFGQQNIDVVDLAATGRVKMRKWLLHGITF